jgi:RNA polymerase sigma factor (sigma-70 family)
MENLTLPERRRDCNVYPIESDLSPETLFEKHQWIVHRLWRRYFRTMTELKMDLLQEGFLSLWNAALQYEPTKGKFSGYAACAVRRSMQWYVNRQSKSICLPENKVRKLYDIGKFEHYFRGKRRREPNHQEIARFFDTTVPAIEKLKGLRLQQLESLNEPVNDDGLTTRGDTFRDDRFVPTLERLEAERLYERSVEVIAQYVSGDVGRNFEIFKMRMGLTGSGDDMTLEEVAKVLGVTRERIRQLEKKILNSIRERLAS